MDAIKVTWSRSLGQRFRNTHVKYERAFSCGLKAMIKVKVSICRSKVTVKVQNTATDGKTGFGTINTYDI